VALYQKITLNLSNHLYTVKTFAFIH